jgi:hypothetical protein
MYNTHTKATNTDQATGAEDMPVDENGALKSQ